MYLAITYIPSVITTILQLRSGDIESLRDENINRFRQAQEEVTILTGSLFWGSLISSFVAGGFCGFIVFFFLVS